MSIKNEIGSARQMGERLGNAMSKNVVDRLFVKLLPNIKGFGINMMVDPWE